MTNSERDNLIVQLDALENKLTLLISNTGNSDLMDCFLEWMKIRNELNKNSLNALQILINRAVNND